METAARLLQLLALLHARSFWTCNELAERLEVTPRTVRRDIVRLRALDHPIETVTGRHGGYQLGRGNQVPPLVLDDREALAVVVGLRLATAGAADGLEESAVAALTKLERVLPERLRERLHDLQAATVMLGGTPAVATNPDHLVVLAQACRRRERIRFLYEARDKVKSFRHVEPLRLVYADRRWYLVAFDLDRDDWRTFRVDRASSPNPTGARCAVRDEPDAAELVRAGRTVAPFEVQATVRLSVPHAEAVRIGANHWGLAEPDGDTTLVRVGGDDPQTLARWLCVLPCSFEVLDPPEVRDAVRSHARMLLNA